MSADHIRKEIEEAIEAARHSLEQAKAKVSHALAKIENSTTDEKKQYYNELQSYITVNVMGQVTEKLQNVGKQATAFAHNVASKTHGMFSASASTGGKRRRKKRSTKTRRRRSRSRSRSRSRK